MSIRQLHQLAAWVRGHGNRAWVSPDHTSVVIVTDTCDMAGNRSQEIDLVSSWAEAREVLGY